MSVRRFRSFAKLNLALEVTGRLPTGYHELKTIFATISLHDIIEIGSRREGIVVKSDQAGLPTDASNLAHRAAALMQRLTGTSHGAAITLRKRIPVGGGLGGGSSNAATVLRALNLIWNARVPPSELIEAARELGADVPYFLVGGAALGLARGDEIHPLDLSFGGRVLLVFGEEGSSTAAVFRRYAELRAAKARTQPSAVDRFIRRLGSTSAKGAPTNFRNDLERPAFDLNPGLGRISREVARVSRETGATQSAMSGSGSTFFMVFEDAEARKEAAAKLRATGVRSRSTSFVSRREFERRFAIDRKF